MSRTIYLIAFIVAALALPLRAAGASVDLPAAPSLSAKSWLLIEFGSGQILAAENADSRIDPASLTKLMTAYLTLAAIRDNSLSLTQKLAASPTATRVGGSRMFIEPASEVSVDELLRGLIVQSGNDAARVLAEAVAGSEAAFVERMNRAAADLGLTTTRFANATGLSDPQHYSSARDLATLSVALVSDFPEAYARYYAEKRFTHNRITQSNRNRLLWIDDSVDGVKTGYTAAAGYCLIASSQRSGRRLLSVVVGTDSDAARTRESLTLLNWGFMNYDALSLYPNGSPVTHLKVWHGATDSVAVGFPGRDFTLAVPRGMAESLQAELISPKPLHAPLIAGQPLGKVRFTLAGAPWGEYPVYSLDTVPSAGVFGRVYDSLRLWLRQDAVN